MRLVKNSGTDRVVDLLGPFLKSGKQLGCMTPALSLFAFQELQEALAGLDRVQLILPPVDDALDFLGVEADRAARNKLQARWLANECAKWLDGNVEVRRARGRVPQGAAIVHASDGTADQVVMGSFAFSTDGLGLTPGNPLSLIQASESAEEAAQLARWLEQQWAALQGQPDSRLPLIEALRGMGQHRAPSTLYAAILNHLFGSRGDEMDEERIVKSATGIRNTVVWKKLFKFQRDGVVGAIDKLARFGGCIIADSVGLGKTFEALAVIKYHELRNDRVLVLAPKRLRDNWTLYKSNDKRNVLAADRYNYDVLNHTDLSRDGGSSGDIDLAQVNWGNYDLVVIDESHNFRNKKSPRQGTETRYDRLMRKIIKDGVKTRVLMLSATPVNNRLADLKNQIAFVTEGEDTALVAHGIDSIEQTTRKAQIQFNRWLAMDEAERTPGHLVEMLGFDYFTLLDHLTIARSRRHVEKYYGTSETGKFPGRLPPINIKADVDLAGQFRAIKDINLEIRRLNLASYAPLRYVLPHKQAAYDAKYSTEIRGGESFFRQTDREESLIHLLRVNVLKRMESAVSSFALTIQRQLKDVEAVLAHIEAHHEGIEEIDIADVDIDDPAFESLLVGRKVKVLLTDVDLIRWKQDLIEDRNRLATLLAAAQQVDAARDAKLAKLRDMVEQKCRQPINAGNRKIIVFTAFSDTAQYLYANLAFWAKATLGIDVGLVTGSAGIQTTLPGLRKSMSSVLSAFAPRAKERPVDMADEGEIDLLIATDCISEGQNLQDCDWLVNYDIHWNPVRIIQRFGRIDRIGSPNQSIQLVNFWPNMELEEYIGLEQRVSGRMVLLDVSATGEENLIEQQSGDPMNDLEYRRKQLLKLQDTVIDMEDLSNGVSITDLTLTDFRIDLAQYLKENPGELDALPLGSYAVTTSIEADIEPGIIFCLRAEGTAAANGQQSDYPLAPIYLAHVGNDGAVLLPYPQAKRILDRLKRLALGRELPDAAACATFDKHTKRGEDMQQAQKLLAAAVASIVGKSEERAVASLFSPGGTHALKGEFAGSNDFEVAAFMVVLPGVAA
ncbi:SNF2 family N-terminal domain-containing protein [Pseudoxanthomonas sp. GM95]|uniref:helicase-related protein n=1 Tax=Pseudoxanthomonas sp. GM95 TaxID=1881043 RepID=UPI0008CAC8F0|nr:helicase-related protein [Pseudoxanthomonas sp. GM95]SEM57632.1 SNF2 family N-terminal domain-containing protein [Pseudoxanthomonas sp. GM95]